MSTPLDFSSLHTPSTCLSSRLYIQSPRDENWLKETVFLQPKKKKDGKEPVVKERLGLGMREYGPIIGTILTLIGIAFKTMDENGKALYINKKSFCALLDRSYARYNDYGSSMTGVNASGNSDKIEERYQFIKDPNNNDPSKEPHRQPAELDSASRIQIIKDLFNKHITLKSNDAIDLYFFEMQQLMIANQARFSSPST